MTKLILVRHGQSLANAGLIFAGHSDFDLSELGHKQAALLAEYLVAHEKITAIHSSDLLRAYHTATPTAERLSLPIVKDEKLREIYAGEWDGRTFSDIEEIFSDDFRVWREDFSSARPTGGESVPEVYRRVVPRLLEIANAHDGETVLVTTHATVVRAMHAYANGFSENEMGKVRFCGNAAINRYEVEGDTVRELAYDVDTHLGDLATEVPKKLNV
ncbi:MAG: histidine phosphatase family protein [Clostridia bacterium]|nr:histidine phosphatase family protein [Clostridia bacterium]